MFGGIDPKKIQGMMSKMGIKQENIPASRVIIEKEDGNIVIENPQIAKITMQGNESFQISGDITQVAESEDSERDIEADIKQIMEKTGAKRNEAERALKDNNGDLAEAILSLA